MKIMKIKIFLPFTLLLGFYGCEKTVIAYPGNTQDTSPKAPEGAIAWQIDVDEDGKDAYRVENSASGTTIGRLNATDDNPDDEVFYFRGMDKLSMVIQLITLRLFLIQVSIILP